MLGLFLIFFHSYEIKSESGLWTTPRFILWGIETVALRGSENRAIEEMRMNLPVVSDSWDVSTANFQSSAFIVVRDKDCDIAVETSRACLLIHWSCTQCQSNSPVYTS